VCGMVRTEVEETEDIISSSEGSGMRLEERLDEVDLAAIATTVL
jgi:hypothetical protein